jgi:hypothetical protein
VREIVAGRGCDSRRYRGERERDKNRRRKMIGFKMERKELCLFIV